MLIYLSSLRWPIRYIIYSCFVKGSNWTELMLSLNEFLREDWFISGEQKHLGFLEWSPGLSTHIYSKKREFPEWIKIVFSIDVSRGSSRRYHFFLCFMVYMVCVCVARNHVPIMMFHNYY